ncbi:hypothetical protein KQI61_05745 [Anaerocolumna aminovalerica]|uniref:hypothetical protein n=1 Tax=Anaerocolumna aminovalerica TaxID=1527 RepID=UPI001C0F11BD|nr:hypothetical protein [Anaerocolumna aminovalerica]MBU5331693.1 hypothetical protein [Anaerocolumna aminovalerica]
MVNVRNFPGCTCKDCEWQKSLCNELPHEDNDVICDDFCKKEDEDENLNFKEM